MKHLCFSRMLTISMVGLGIVFISPKSWAFLPSSSDKLAQITPPSLIPEKPSIPKTSSDIAYDRYMQAGYAATDKKDYAAAKEQFQKALAEKPQDIYAQQAIHNIDVYLDYPTNPFAKDNWGLVLGAIALLAGLGVAFWLLFRTLAPRLVAQSPAKTKPSLPITTVVPETHLESVPALNPDESLEESLLIQTTTSRLPGPDLMDTLVLGLRDPNPQTRRKAIWDLAQKADSRAMKPLVELMIETDSQERTLILEALSQISTRTLKPMNQALALSLQDKNPQVRKNAIRDLTRIYDVMSQISQMLSYAIDDSDGEVQETAKWALSQLNLQMPHRFDISTRPPQGAVTVEQSYAESGE